MTGQQSLSNKLLTRPARGPEDDDLHDGIIIGCLSRLPSSTHAAPGFASKHSFNMRLLQSLLVVVIFGLIFGALFGGGAFLLVRNVPMIVEGWQSRSWPVAVGNVQESAAVSKPVVSSARRGTVGTHVVRLRYEFAVDGRTFTGTRQSLDDVGIIKTEEQSRSEAGALPAGSSVRVFYDPSDPAISLLTPGVPIGGVISSVFGLLLIAAGSAMVAVGLHLRSHHAKRRKMRGG